MGLDILLVPTLAGYRYLTRFNRTRYSVLHVTGYACVFRSAVVGVVLFAFAYEAALVFNEIFPKFIEILRQLIPPAYLGLERVAAALSLPFGFIVPSILNKFRRFDSFECRRKAAEEAGDQIGLVVDQAIEHRQLVELSFANGKSYIGAPLNGTVGQRSTGDVAIVPIMSGYRDSEMHTLELTTFYMDHLPDGACDRSNVKMRRFRVALPVRDIASARLFDLDVYTKFVQRSGDDLVQTE